MTVQYGIAFEIEDSCSLLDLHFCAKTCERRQSELAAQEAVVPEKAAAAREEQRKRERGTRQSTEIIVETFKM